MEIAELDLAYAAGLIDGEGSIGLFEEHKERTARTHHSPSHRPFLSVGMTDEVPVRWLHETFGVGSVQYSLPKPPRREKWTWRVNGAGVRVVCDLLMPYLKVKGLQAYLVVCFYEEGNWGSRRGQRLHQQEILRRQSLKREFHEANSRGC